MDNKYNWDLTQIFKNEEDFNNSKNEVLPKTHGFRDVIKKLEPESLIKINRKIISKSKENKVYRDGSIDSHVVVGIDGVECFGSYKKDWANSYKTMKK